MNKSYVLLKMYDSFRTGKAIDIGACCTEFHISVSTFRRYIAFLREYFLEAYAQEIVYDEKDAKYRIRK